MEQVHQWDKWMVQLQGRFRLSFYFFSPVDHDYYGTCGFVQTSSILIFSRQNFSPSLVDHVDLLKPFNLAVLL